MYRISRKLKELTECGKKIRIGLIGCGKMGKGLLSQLNRIEGITPSVIVEHTPKKAYDALIALGVPGSEILITEDEAEAQRFLTARDGFIISANERIGCTLREIDCVVESTGNPSAGARIAVMAIEQKKHIVMLNVECDCAVGPILYKKAQEAGVVYTGIKGDEPGAIMELVDFATGSGFEIVAVGKGKNNKLNREATDITLAEEARSKGLSPHMLCSFVDGTNTMTELTTVCNATGFIPDVDGCHGITTDPQEIADVLKLRSQGGILTRKGVVEFAFGMAPGVFAIVTSEEPEVIDLMKYLGLGDGPNYTLYRPYHLTSLEAPITIFDAVVEHEASIAPIRGQVADAVMVAKRDIKAGEPIKGIGRDTVYALIVDHRKQQAENLVSIALVDDEAIFTRDIKKGEWITAQDCRLNEAAMIVKLRAEQDALGL